MKKILTSTIAALTLAATAPAFGADLTPRYKAPPPAAPPIIYNWTGCYIGGNLGGGWSRNSLATVTSFLGTPIAATDFGSNTGSAFIGGGQIGCDYQFAGNWLVGVQGMFDFGNTNSSRDLTAIGFPGFIGRSQVKDIFTATGRIGYLFTPQFLGYVKGGGAWARNNLAIIDNFGITDEFANADRSGWTVGAGVEWMFAPNWSVFGEYNFADFGHHDVLFNASPGFVFTDTLTSHLTVQQFLVGVNWRFNWGGLGSPPVAAKY